jgi:hypothetical protein
VLPRGGLVRVVIQLGDFTTRSGIKGSQLEGFAFRPGGVTTQLPSYIIKD